MKNNLSRREFLRRAALAAAGTGVAAPFISRHLRAAPPSDTLLHASIGSRGQAGRDLQELARHPDVKLVAIADVDSINSARWKDQFPDVRIYQDWRELLEKEKSLDIVNVSTPD